MNTVVANNRKRILQALLDFPAQYGYPPSVMEIAEALQLSPTTVHRHLLTLKEAGVIVSTPRKPRSIRIVASVTTR